MKFTRFIAVLSGSLITATAAQADGYIVPYVGYFDVVRHKDTATQFGLEYRFDPLQYGVRPMVGANVTTDGAAYGYAGLAWDVPLIDKQLYLIPNFAIGAYSQGDGRRLGGPIEFRSGIELDYQFYNAHRIGISFNHISNAGIYDHNPGAETLLVNYSIPLGAVTSWMH